MLDNLDLRNRQADAEHIVSYLSTDALESPYNFALSSCNHMVHYNCFSRMMQRQGATLHKNCSDFLCPVCRRLATCFFPILVTPQISARFAQELSGSELATDGPKAKLAFVPLLEKNLEKVNRAILNVAQREEAEA